MTNNVIERLKFNMKNNERFKTFLEEKVFLLVQNPAKIWATLALQKCHSSKYAVKKQYSIIILKNRQF